ncbi:2-amino-4-hydroxy-6-hydroxymethyldihydropteridine diphosphokinase [Agromyces mangrovi Wang et al. 2018]|uniref:2-amino-4-hydroxy-6- hydroxymethyldihydropteridine diphosphokinase n=1 Tax=Agromyces mangrovi TaxID=1858653 RepID=UPI002573D858|nr:2-amino-4-hydroxy-6-hydroxymethyldihydropteridine diphosphokinase [Agromyces mangrovi]BDZ63969.1 2-amino-4-hydroxy-6-hydroxymethyldihydropteridine diphosphokinase [Agromyces mangrovi]
MALFRQRRGDRGTHVVLAFGSSLGDREGTIGQAIADVDMLRETRVEAISPTYETIAITDEGADPDAPAYLNCVIAIRTDLSPHALLDAIHTIERGHGRVRDEHWGPRTLDIDIITFGGLELDDETLTIPHPRAWQRAFVLQPWLDIEPKAVIPGYGRIDELRAVAFDEVAPYEPDQGAS